MTKRELIESLAGFKDDQEVYIRLHSKDYPGGSQVAIQGLAATVPWRDLAPDGSNCLIALVAHAENGNIQDEIRWSDQNFGLSSDLRLHSIDNLAALKGVTLKDE